MKGANLKDHGAICAAQRAPADVLPAKYAAKAQRCGAPERGNAKLLFCVPARSVWCQLLGRKVSGQPLELLLRSAPGGCKHTPAWAGPSCPNPSPGLRPVWRADSLVKVAMCCAVSRQVPSALQACLHTHAGTT